MRTFIRWLADISGVTNKIKVEAYKEVGGSMYQAHYWWNGGIQFNVANWPVWNAFLLYSKALKDGHHSPDMMRIREEVYKTGDRPIKE